MQKRLFIALDLPECARRELARLCTGLPGAHWSPEEQLHLTLCFLGDTEGTDFLDLREALAEIEAPAFPLALSGLGFFPPRGEPRTLWAGVATNPALSPLNHLQEKIVSCVRGLGLPLEKRKFTPHITLARFAERPAKLQNYLAARSLFATTPFPIAHFRLYSSILGRAGATHFVEAEYALADSDNAQKKSHKKSGFNPKVEAAEISGGDERN